MHECEYKDGKRLFLIDTPGFDDTYKSDTDILREVANWLSEAYQRRIQLTGIVYLHRILDVRLGGAAMKNLRMFKELCGPEGLSSVVLATTMWRGVEMDRALQREQQLVTSPKFWAGMIAKGSKVMRQDQEAESAMAIVDYLVARKRPVVLDIQRQLVDDNMTLDRTSAGMEVQAEIAKHRELYQKKLDEYKQEMQAAIRAKDKESQDEILSLRREIEQKLKKDEEDRLKLQADKDELRRQMDEQLAKERQEFMEKIQEAEARIRQDEESQRELQLQQEELRRKLDERASQDLHQVYANNERIARQQHEMQIELMRTQHQHDLKLNDLKHKLEQERQDRARLQKKYDASCVVM
jgi:peptidoglycan/xylan/chitin deacetylase (PgdA/CDA1 family)